MKYTNLIYALRCCSASADTIENLLTQNRAQQGIIEKQSDLIVKLQDKVKDLENELRDEKHRFDRLSDFEVAESQLLAEARAELAHLR